MRTIGFSTGALARGDFRTGLELIVGHRCAAVELSALREHELPELMGCLGRLALGQFTYVSVHAPSRLETTRESDVAGLLLPCVDRGWPVVLHPDAIQDHGCWRDFGSLLLLENMDKRKRSGRTALELQRHFAELPDARLCLDLGHARQVDPTLGIARQLLGDYGDRVVQIHLSEVDARSHHAPLSMATVWAIREIARVIPAVPVILESMVKPEQIGKEIEMAARCFEVPARPARRAVPV